MIELYKLLGREDLMEDHDAKNPLYYNQNLKHMFLTFNENLKRFEFAIPFQKRDVAKKAGFKWDVETKTWFTEYPAIARLFEPHADPACKAIFEQIEKNLIRSRHTGEGVDLKKHRVPCPANLEYKPYQQIGIIAGNRIFNVGKNPLLADEMGLGKTIQAIGLINTNHENFKKVLIVTPAKLKHNWFRELAKWLTRRDYAAIVDANTRTWPLSNIVIINYDILHKYEAVIKTRHWDLAIVDEAHKIKNENTRRGESFFKIMNAVDKKIFISGTPIDNYVKEIFNLVNVLDPETFNDKDKFVQRFGNKTMKEDLRRKRLLELNELLRANVMIRRMKADVEKDLPEKTRQIITIEERTQAVVKQMEIYSSYEDGLKKAKVELEIAKATLNDEDYREALKNYKQTVSYPFEEIAKYRLEVGRDKLKHAIDQIEDMLEENIKMVVFTYHQEIVEALYAKFGPSISVLSTGKTSAQASQKAVDDFQNNDSIRIFFGTMKANNTGITLTAASYALFVEQDWVPATMLQAEDRIHRIGQTAKSTMLHLVFKNSIDEKLMETIIKKMETINLALNENTVDDDLSMTVIPGSEAYSLRFMTRKEYMQKASMISPQRISEIYIELKELLAMNIDFKQTMYLNIAQRLLNMPESKMAAVLAERCIKALKTKENGFKEE